MFNLKRCVSGHTDRRSANNLLRSVPAVGPVDALPIPTFRVGMLLEGVHFPGSAAAWTRPAAFTPITLFSSSRRSGSALSAASGKNRSAVVRPAGAP